MDCPSGRAGDKPGQLVAEMAEGGESVHIEEISDTLGALLRLLGVLIPLQLEHDGLSYVDHTRLLEAMLRNGNAREEARERERGRGREREGERAGERGRESGRRTKRGREGEGTPRAPQRSRAGQREMGMTARQGRDGSEAHNRGPGRERGEHPKKIS